MRVFGSVERNLISGDSEPKQLRQHAIGEEHAIRAHEACQRNIVFVADVLQATSKRPQRAQVDQRLSTEPRDVQIVDILGLASDEVDNGIYDISVHMQRDGWILTIYASKIATLC